MRKEAVIHFVLVILVVGTWGSIYLFRDILSQYPNLGQWLIAFGMLSFTTPFFYQSFMAGFKNLRISGGGIVTPLSKKESIFWALVYGISPLLIVIGLVAYYFLAK